MNYSTYRLTFPDGTFYVGSTSNTRQRFYSHKSYCKSGTHANHKLQTAWTTFGNPDLQVLNYYATKAEAIEAEQKLITEYFGTEECLNISSNAKCNWNTEEYKAKMSADRKGKPRSAETRAKLSAYSKTQKGIEQLAAARKNSNKVRRKPLTIGTQTFTSQTEAAKHFNVSHCAMSKAVQRGTFRGVPITRN